VELAVHGPQNGAIHAEMPDFSAQTKGIPGRMRVF
jgi:hypothetical protein